MANRDPFRQTEVEIAQAMALRCGAELVNAIAENPKTRRAAEKFAASLLMATSAAEVEQQGAIVPIGKRPASK